MSKHELKDKDGKTYLLQAGAGPKWPDRTSLASCSISADKLLERFCHTQLNNAMFSVAGHLANQAALCNPCALPIGSSGMRLVAPCAKRAINDGLSSNNLVIHKMGTTEVEASVEDGRSTLKIKIQNALAVIIANEKEEARQIDIGYQKRSWIGKEIAESWHFVTGIALAGYGMAEQGYELAKKASEIYDVVSARARLIHSLRYAYIAAKNTSGTNKSFVDEFKKEQLSGNKRQLAEALAVLPSALDMQKLAQAFEFAELIWADTEIRAILGQFGIDYVKAQHKLEQAEMAGGIAFEVILTVILAALTAGAGVAVSAASQTRHVGKFGKVGKLLVELGESLKTAKQKMKSHGAKSNKGNTNPSLYDDKKADEIIVAPITRKVENKPTQKEQTEKDTDTDTDTDTDDNFDYDSPRNVTYDDFCGTVKDFKDGGPDAEKAYALFKEEKWDELEMLFKEKDLNGGWPPNGGAISVNTTTLKPPKTVDRYGGWVDENGKFNDTGAYLANANEPFENRALPKDTLGKPYKQYKVVKEIPNVKSGKVIPWFGEPGKGFQYELPKSVAKLVKMGYLEEI